MKKTEMMCMILGLVKTGEEEREPHSVSKARLFRLFWCVCV